MSSKVGVLIVGLNGATANTLVAGAICGRDEELQQGSVIAGAGLDAQLNPVEDFVFGGWDVTGVNAFDAASHHEILPPDVITREPERLRAIRPLAAFVGEYDTDEARRSEHARTLESADEARKAICADVEAFKREHDLARCVAVLLGPPLRARPAEDAGSGIGLPSGAVYALGALDAGCGVIDFTPNVTLELEEVVNRAKALGLPLAGRDGNTGQTLMKTVIGQMLRLRNLRLTGWYSTNFLGNEDGRVLARPEHRELKMSDKLEVLAPILGYDDFEHVVDISFYGPRGDDKEAWDSIDFAGWFGLPMAMKINWLGRDSILAAPLVSDLIRHVEYAMRNGLGGHLEHLGLYFKHPLGSPIVPLATAYETLVDFYINDRR